MGSLDGKQKSSSNPNVIRQRDREEVIRKAREAREARAKEIQRIKKIERKNSLKKFWKYARGVIAAAIASLSVFVRI